MQTEISTSAQTVYQHWQIQFVFDILANQTDATGKARYCAARLARAQDLVEANKLRRPEADDPCSARWMVESQSEFAEYPVTGRVCACKDHERTGDYCKHGLAAQAMEWLEMLYTGGQAPETAAVQETPPLAPECGCVCHSGIRKCGCDCNKRPPTCPRCGRVATSERSRQTLRTDGACVACLLNDDLYGPEDAA